MSANSQNKKIIFGLKVKQLRGKMTLDGFSTASGLSKSYLNEIEKGKKYPKADKIAAIANALDVSVEELTSQELTKNLAPISDLLHSNFLNELPLDLFGIDLSKVVEIIAFSPLRVGAFISTLVELARNYALREENFYLEAMRSYLELHHNYFEEIEEAVDKVIKEYKIPKNGPVPEEILIKILKEKFNYKIIEDGLKDHPELHNLRSLFIPKKKRLLLNSSLTGVQRTFQLGKEIGFSILSLKERANTSNLMKIKSFEQVLNHFKASYFSTALLINKSSFINDLENFFGKSRWNGEAFIGLMKKYEASPEMLYQRLTNIIPRYLGLQKMFMFRFVHEPAKDYFEIDKELHLERKHQPHSNGLREHYCRRWLSLSLLNDLNKIQSGGKYVGTIVGAQRSTYHGTDDEYLCFTLARPDYPTPDRNVSVTIGLLVDDELKEKIKFLDDPSISHRIVNTTCERCPITDCTDRAVPATIIKKREQRRKVQDALKELSGE